MKTFNSLTYKKKNIFLSIALIVVALFVYQLAIKSTLQAYEEFSLGKAQIEQAINAPTEALAFKKQLIKIDKQIASENVLESEGSQTLLGFVIDYCQNNEVVLREFPKMETEEQGDLKVQTSRFVVQGTFASLVGLIYNLEQKNKFGKISSVRYELKKDMKTKQMMLSASVFLQNVKNENHEK